MLWTVTGRCRRQRGRKSLECTLHGPQADRRRHRKLTSLDRGDALHFFRSEGVPVCAETPSSVLAAGKPHQDELAVFLDENYAGDTRIGPDGFKTVRLHVEQPRTIAKRISGPRNPR